jgi:hypothetical protein
VVAVTGEWDRPPLPAEGQRRDVLAPLRAVRDSRVGPEERRAKVIDAIRGMAENGLDATATAELRGFVKDHKLLDLGSVSPSSRKAAWWAGSRGTGWRPPAPTRCRMSR